MLIPIFPGTYDFSVGTQVFFEKDDDPPPTEPVFDKEIPELYRFSKKTHKVLNLNRIFVDSKEKPEGDDIPEIPIESTFPLPTTTQTTFTYEEALNILPKGIEKKK